MDLKIKYAPLTHYQMDLVENRDKYEARLRAVEQRYRSGDMPSEEAEPEEEYYDEEPAPQEPEFLYEEDPMTSNLVASMEEADVQETLARELSKISYEEPEFQQEAKLEHTRVLEDIRRVGRPMTSVKRPKGTYFSQEEEMEFNSQPMIEEEDITGPGLDESQLSQYDIGEFDDNQFNAQDLKTPDISPYSEIDSEESDYESSDEHAEEQSAVTAEPLYESYDSENNFAEESYSEPAREEPDYVQADHLQFEDLYEEDEDELEEAPVRNHLMIEARTPEKGLSMAVEALKQIHKENGVNNPVAKITGSKLSKRGVLACADKLAGKDLVVEEAGDLTSDALNELNQIMSQDTSGMIVVLIDNPKQMEILHREHPALASKFECIGSGEVTPVSKPQTSVSQPQILREQPESSYVAPSFQQEDTYHPQASYQAEDSYSPQDGYQEDYGYEDESNYLPEEEYDSQETIEEKTTPRKKFFFRNKKESQSRVVDQEVNQSVREEAASYAHNEEMDIDEFAQYACRYANEIDCSITGKSMLALYERIEIMEEDGIALSRSAAEGLIEEAADRAEKPSFGKRFKNLFSSKYDKDGLLVLQEEHFIY
jgi:hypothetical protein